MAKIIAPNKRYNGISASVQFKEGVGYTDNPRLIEWFERKGYTVEREEPAAPTVAAEAGPKSKKKTAKKGDK